MEKLPIEPEGVQKVEYHYHQKPVASNEVIDWILNALVIIIVLAIMTTFFVDFNASVDVNIEKATTQAVWLAFASFCLGELGKRIFRRKGQRTKAFKEAEANATAEIKSLNTNGYAKYADKYCTKVTEDTIERYRKNQLYAIGIDYKTYKEKYLGKGLCYLLKLAKKGEISRLQARALYRCNAVKVKHYNPAFITSYNAEDNAMLVPSEQNNTTYADTKNTVTSLIFSLGSAFGVGFMFYDVLVNFSLEALFFAFVKLVVLAISFALKATFGWNLAIIEMQRNRLRESEAKACAEYAKTIKALEK